jgi:predicted regulator of Ras-like GTPase activity (Roadblock/LC7/MglB family)
MEQENIEKMGKAESKQSLKSVMEEMAEQVEGLLCIAVAGSDGVAIATHVPSGSVINAELAAAQLAAIFRMSRATSDKLKAGELDDNLLTSTSGQILIKPLDTESYIAMVTTREAPLGIIRLVVRSYADKIEQALGKVG